MALPLSSRTVTTRSWTARFRPADAGARALLRLVAVGISLFGVASPTRALEPASELEVKAAFILNFLKFVDWPDAHAPATSPVLVLAVGEDPLVRVITATAGQTRVAGRPVQVRAVRAGAAIEGAHMVFIAGSERHQLPAILRQLDGHPVLTVAATDGFAESGVVLNLVVRDRKVRVEANTAAASRARLRVSAHLLRLARIVG
jgi:hypothetical protein